jgi:hypothetical protein
MLVITFVLEDDVILRERERAQQPERDRRTYGFRTVVHSLKLSCSHRV